MPTGDDLIDWQGALINEILLAPVKPYMLPGDEWTAQGLVRLPQLQLGAIAPHQEVTTTYRFEGESAYQGIPCHRFKSVTKIDGADWALVELVNAEYASQFQVSGLEVQAGGILTVTQFWISQETRLPVHTELKSTASVWWRDPRFPARYVGSHDSKNYENWEEVNFVVTYGRVLEADFETREEH